MDKQTNEDRCLCEAHVISFGAEPGTFVLAAEPEDEDAPIECDACTVAAMRRMGAL